MAGTGYKDPVPDAVKFEGQGINFRAKLIGKEDVPEARGDQMCQESIQKLKAIVKASREHKQRIIVNVSLEGLKILDQATANMDHAHEVHRISFISRDMTDSRAFGYIYGPGDGSHKFFAIKTEKAAEGLVLSLRDLFQVVYDLKKKEVEDAKRQNDASTLTLEGAEVGESDDSVYQVPQNGAPVEGTESVYAVPQNNKPVQQSGGNLLDLEDQLTSIEKGIEQMSTFDTLFGAESDPAVSTASSTLDDAWGTPATVAPAASISSSQDLFGSAGFGTTGAPAVSTTIPGFTQTSSQQLFGVPAGSTTIPGIPQAASQPAFGAQNFGGAMPGTPFPGGAPGLFQPGLSSTVRPGGFGAAPVVGFGVQPANPSPFGAPPANPSPFGAPPGNPVPFGLPPPPSSTQSKQAGLPLATDPFSNDPFTSAVPQGHRATGMMGQPSGNPFGAPTSGGNLFPPSTVASDNSSGWPSGDILAPVKLGVIDDPEDVQEKKVSTDPFSDLCDIGSVVSKEKTTPKDMFKEIAAPPRKTLNELKAESLATQTSLPRTPSPQPPFGSSMPGQAGDPFGQLGLAPSVAPTPALNDPFGNVPLVPTTQQASFPLAHDPFVPLDKGVNNIPDLATTSSDPFDTSSFLHLSNLSRSTTCKIITSQEHNHQRPRPRAKIPENILNGESSKLNNISVFQDSEFNLPSPDEPPPPLPSDAFILSKNAPKPPPRPTSVNTKYPVPVTRSSSLKLNDSVSVQSNLSGSSSGSNDQDTLSSLSPNNSESSYEASPVPRAVPRRKSLSSSSESSATLPTHAQDRLSPMLNTCFDINPKTNKLPVQRPPVPKPRKSLTKTMSFNSADFKTRNDSDPFSPDPFAPASFLNHNNIKDYNDNDPFLSSQSSSVLGDFDLKWDTFSSDFETFSSQNCNDKSVISLNVKDVKESKNNNPPPFGDPF